MKRWRAPVLGLLLGLGAVFASSAAPVLEVAWRDGTDGTFAWRAFDADGQRLADAPPPAVPLGSLWKLFVFAYLVERGEPAPDYVCRGPAAGDAAREEGAYCCDPGETIGRDAALVASCGVFFEPARLGITASDWHEFWAARAAGAPWLAELASMRADTAVSPASLIAALEAVPARARETASGVLLARVLGAGGGDSAALARYVGGTLRVKTFSWFRPGSRSGERYGGGAGWLVDGTPVWFAGTGTGQQVMARHGALLAAALPPVRATLAAGCVEVDFFARYPLVRVEGPDGRPAKVGALQGRHVAVFANGVALPFVADGGLRLVSDDGKPRVQGRFGVDDYVARVVDREADAGEREAARALAVVARSYLFNEAEPRGNCLFIADSSRTQRVSPNPPTTAAREVAAFTTDLVLRGAAVGYHSDTPGPDRLAWSEAVAAGRSGRAWDDILRRAFPAADLTAARDPAGIPCERLDKAERWLAERAPQWRRALNELPGFEPPAPPSVCRLRFGAPFSELDRGRIHVRDLRTLEDRITLAHEYLHLGLRHYPASGDEALVERWARRLVAGEQP